jgi:Ca2+-binding EF-hand superfamily protein
MRQLFTASILVVVALGWALVVSPSTAEAGKGKKKDKTAALFQKLDTNNDGKLSQDEFSKISEVGKKKAGKGKGKNTSKMFAKLDADNDGSLSLDEFKKKAELKKGKKNKAAK